MQATCGDDNAVLLFGNNVMQVIHQGVLLENALLKATVGIVGPPAKLLWPEVQRRYEDIQEKGRIKFARLQRIADHNEVKRRNVAQHKSLRVNVKQQMPQLTTICHSKLDRAGAGQ